METSFRHCLPLPSALGRIIDFGSLPVSPAALNQAIWGLPHTAAPSYPIAATELKIIERDREGVLAL